MKFCVKYEYQGKSFNIGSHHIGFGIDSMDLYLDMKVLSNSSSNLGQSYILVENIDGKRILAG